jgi:hypothetical protein
MQTAFSLVEAYWPMSSSDTVPPASSKRLGDHWDHRSDSYSNVRSIARTITASARSLLAMYFLLASPSEPGAVSVPLRDYP